MESAFWGRLKLTGLGMFWALRSDRDEDFRDQSEAPESRHGGFGRSDGVLDGCPFVRDTPNTRVQAPPIVDDRHYRLD